MASNSQKDHPSSSTAEGKPASANSKGSKSETSFVEPQSEQQRVATDPGTEFPANPFDFSAMSDLLNVVVEHGKGYQTSRLATWIRREPSKELTGCSSRAEFVYAQPLTNYSLPSPSIVIEGSS